MELQTRVLDAIKHLTTSAQPVADAAAAAFRELVPQTAAVDQLGRAADHATKSAILSVFKRLTLDYAQDAMHKGQFPLQYKAGKAAEPVLQRLLSAALWCNSQDLIEAASFLSILDDLQDICTVEHCMDIITWLENNIAVLASPQIADAPFGVNSFTRVCNGILKRLGKHEVISKARLLMLIASITPLFDRSGLGITGALAPPDPPTPEAVPEDAVDSTGKPVDILLYKHFWSLQTILQNPLSALNSLDTWAAFKKELSVVLENLARTPASVTAARAVVADAQLEKESRDEGARTQCYLSSYKLFGLQLTDSAFRRDFLVQVLIMLRTLLIPGKVPADTLKPKQRMEALTLEKDVYKVLELTPRSGKEFCRAIREVLERETTWVSWKKGGTSFVVPGKEQEAPAASAAPGSKKAAPQQHQTCIEWNKPPVPSLSAAVAKANAAAEHKRQARKRAHEEGLQMKQADDRSGRQYDNLGEPPDHGGGKRALYLQLLGNNSSLAFWAQARIADRSLQDQPLLSGMKMTEQAYPTADAVAAQALREMDPDAGIEPAFRRVADDGVYRWRVGRIAAHGLTEWDGENAQKVEDAVKDVLADKLPPALKAQIEREKAAKGAAAKAAAATKAEQQAGKAGSAGAAATASHAKTAAGDEQDGSAAAAAAGGHTPAASDGGAAADDDAAADDAVDAAVKQEAAEDGVNGMEVDAGEV